MNQFRVFCGYSLNVNSNVHMRWATHHPAMGYGMAYLEDAQIFDNLPDAQKLEQIVKTRCPDDFHHVIFIEVNMDGQWMCYDTAVHINKLTEL